jgi:hypothetical protein
MEEVNRREAGAHLWRDDWIREVASNDGFDVSFGSQAVAVVVISTDATSRDEATQAKLTDQGVAGLVERACDTTSTAGGFDRDIDAIQAVTCRLVTAEVAAVGDRLPGVLRMLGVDGDDERGCRTNDLAGYFCTERTFGKALGMFGDLFAVPPQFTGKWWRETFTLHLNQGWEIIKGVAADVDLGHGKQRWVPTRSARCFLPAGKGHSLGHAPDSVSSRGL